MKRIPSIEDFLIEGLTLQEAVMAQEAMASSVIEGARPMSAKRFVEILDKERIKDG